MPRAPTAFSFPGLTGNLAAVATPFTGGGSAVGEPALAALVGRFVGARPTCRLITNLSTGCQFLANFRTRPRIRTVILGRTRDADPGVAA